MKTFRGSLAGAIARGGAPSAGMACVFRGVGRALAKLLRARAESERRLKIVERLKVTPRQGLLLVEVGDERLIIATSDGSASAFYSLKKQTEIRIEGSCA